MNQETNIIRMIVTRAMAEAAMLRRAAMTLLLAVMTTTTATAYQLADETKWTIEKFNNDADCYITGYTGTTEGVTELTIPTTIDGATVKKFKDFSLEGFTNLVTLNFYTTTKIEEMPSLKYCSAFKAINLILENNGNAFYTNVLPFTIKVIPAYAFYSTKLEYLIIEVQESMTIGDYAFSCIEDPCSIYYYGGSASDWNNKKIMGSKKLRVCLPSPAGSHEEDRYFGWYGDSNIIDVYNTIYWTRDKNLRMTITSDNWDTFHTYQVLTQPYLHSDIVDSEGTFVSEGTEVKSLYIEHVYAIEDKAFTMFRDLETVEIASGLTAIGKEAFKNCPITSVTLPITLERIGDLAFPSGCKLTDVYFDGTKEQWDAVTKGTDWNSGRTSNYQEHWRCTLTFDMQGHGTAPAPQTVYTNTALTPPEEPTAQGYTFVGWYCFPTAAQPCNFAGGISENTTLYARWTANTNTITFDLNNQDGHGTAIDAQTLTTGNVVSVPAMQYYIDGDSKVYGIEGWYTDAACTKAYDFTTVVDHSFTLYAKWAEATGTATVNDYTGGTVTLTDELGREVQFGKIFPGRYTLTVTPASGYSFSGSYSRTKRSDSMGEMAHTFGGTTAYTAQIDLTAHDVAVNVTFSEMTTYKVYVTVNADEGVEAGTFTLADNANHSYEGDGTETLAKVNDGSEALWNTDYNLTLTITKGESGCAATVVNNDVTTYIDNSTSTYTFTPTGSVDIRLHFFEKDVADVTLADNGSNSATLAGKNDGQSHTVKLKDRKLWKDGDWNTLCLPFALKSITGTPLEGATVMRLNTTSKSSGIYQTRFDEESGTLNLYFSSVSSGLAAGQPYIVRWGTHENPAGGVIEDPVFNGVFITATEPGSVTSNDGTVSFCGRYDYVEYTTENRSILFLGKDNTLYFPQPSNEQNPSIGACRSYFTLSDITAGDVPAAGARAFVLNFGDDLGSETGIISTTNRTNHTNSGAWYSLDGRRLSAKPTQRGVYINNGKKVVIK